MKVALIGTHATGKTTLAYDIASSLKKRNFNVDFLGEVSRDCPFPINEDTTKSAQKWILLTQYVREIEKEGKCDYLICDRSLLDNYAYYIRKFGESKELEPLILEHMGSYDYLFKVPINEKYLVSDGVRSIDKEFQEEIDCLIDKLLQRFDIHFYDYADLEKTIEIIERGR
jgi:nicotinamide riboside kinase